MNLFRMSLTLQMAIATVLGVLFGIFFGDFTDLFTPWAAAYLMILKITAVPYLIVAIMHGVGQLSSSQFKEILKKGAIFIGLTWAINILIIYAVYFLFPQAKGEYQLSIPTSAPTSVMYRHQFCEHKFALNVFFLEEGLVSFASSTRAA